MNLDNLLVYLVNCLGQNHIEKPQTQKYLFEQVIIQHYYCSALLPSTVLLCL